MRNFVKSSTASGKHRSGYMARAAIICMAILCIVALSLGCSSQSEHALVRVSAVKVKRYGNGDTAVSGGSRYQLGGYCVYLDAVTSHLGIEATYDAFVEYLEDNSPVGL